MKEQNMHFGEYIKMKRRKDPRELTITHVAEYIGVSRGYLCDVENLRKAPFDGEKMELLAKCLNLTEEETALMYDLASRYNRNVPHDLMDTFLHEEVGELARVAMRLSKGVDKPEAQWKQLIRELEAQKKGSKRGGANGGDN